MDKGVHTFLKGVSLKVNVIVQLKFEIAYYDVAVATGTPPLFLAEDENTSLNISLY